MDSIHVSRFEALQQSFPVGNAATALTIPNGYEILKEKVIAIVSGHYEWPGPQEAQLTISHAIYMEPILGSPGKFQPFWGLPPRIYYQLDLGWPVSVVGWFNYFVHLRTDGQPAGDSEFPSGDPGRCVVRGLLDSSNLLFSHVPGQLLVVFRDGVDESAARKVVAREMPLVSYLR